LHRTAGWGDFQHQALHLRDERSKLALETEPFAPGLGATATEQSVAKGFQSKDYGTGAEDPEASSQVLDSSLGCGGFTALETVGELAGVHGKLSEKGSTELHQLPGIASGIGEDVITVEGDGFGLGRALRRL
jgi:hypothetical protein